MAGKSRRVAARQGELSRRRKRAQRGPSGIPAVPSQPQQNGGGAAATAVETAVSVAAPAAGQPAAPAPTASVAAARRPSSQNAVQPRGAGRIRGERPAAYNYVGAELRRIGILSTAVLTALIVLAIVL